MDILSHLSEAVSVLELFTVHSDWPTKAAVSLGFLSVSTLGSGRPTDSRDCHSGVLIKGKKLSAFVPQSGKKKKKPLTVQTFLLLFKKKKKKKQTRLSPAILCCVSCSQSTPAVSFIHLKTTWDGQSLTSHPAAHPLAPLCTGPTSHQLSFIATSP